MRAVLTMVLLLLALPAAAQDAPFALELVADDLDSPTYAIAPVGDPRLFIVEQSGTIRIMENGVVLPDPFLDISGSVSCCGEQGLLGLAFHPDYAANGRFFVNFTNETGDTRVTEFHVSDDPNIADPQPVGDLLEVAQPYSNHNGGWVDFGPDGLLYVGMGDGGAGGDPHGNGQNLDSQLGKILRVNVDSGTSEVFATGVRNPWRNTFDGDQLYIADVGQGMWEEVDVVGLGNAGVNLGWNIMEGAVCYERGSCDETGLVPPIHVYSHDTGCSITGGFVYRGSAIPALQGHYLFGDYCGGQIFSLLYADGAASEVTDWTEHGIDHMEALTSFGRDSSGELYVMQERGRLYKIVPAS